MTNKPKQKGTAFETLIADYFRLFWPWVERRTLSGSLDKGDIAGLPDVIEAKNHQTMNLGGWMNEASKEAANATARGFVVVHKRRGYGWAGHQYVTMTLEHYVRLLQAEPFVAS